MNYIEKAITEYFDTNWTTTSIQWPNTNLNTNSLSAFVQLTIVPTDKYHLILGDPTSDALIHERGLVNINIFVKPNTGSGVSQGYASTIMDLFHYTELTIDTGESLQFGVARVAQNGRNEGAWWMMTIICDFWILK